MRTLQHGYEMEWSLYVYLNTVLSFVSVAAQNFATKSEFIVPLWPNITEEDIIKSYPNARILNRYTISPRCNLALVELQGNPDSHRFHDPTQQRPYIRLTPNKKIYAFAGHDEGHDTSHDTSHDTRYEKRAESQTYDDPRPYIRLTPDKEKYAFRPNNESHVKGTRIGTEPLNACYVQQTGEKYWGLTRISHDKLPDFSPDDAYVFESTEGCVDIFVMDTGVNVYHETFQGRAFAAYTVKDLIDKEGHYDLVGHGTHVAGLAAGTVHGSGKHANIFSVKVIGRNHTGQLNWILEGLEWIANHLNETQHLNSTSIINLSLGLLDLEGDYDYLDECFRALPAVVVAAAGNEKRNACQTVPARFKSVITVGATDKHDNLMSRTNGIGSNTGTCVDLLAPGDVILSASHMSNTSEVTHSGTSMAAGYVSGVVARLMNNFTSQPSTSEMKELLKNRASRGHVSEVSDTYTPNLIVHVSCMSEHELLIPDISAIHPPTCHLHPDLGNWTLIDIKPQIKIDSSSYDTIFVIVVVLVVALVGLLALEISYQYRRKTKVDDDPTLNPRFVMRHTEAHIYPLDTRPSVYVQPTMQPAVQHM